MERRLLLPLRLEEGHVISARRRWWRTRRGARRAHSLCRCWMWFGVEARGCGRAVVEEEAARGDR